MTNPAMTTDLLCFSLHHTVIEYVTVYVFNQDIFFNQRSFMSHTPLPSQKLTLNIQPEQLPFSDTSELESFQGVLGQDRAVNAIQFGVAMERPGYNIFVMGDSGTGRSSYVQGYLKSEAKRQQTPEVWCYVNNFKNPREPKALALAPQQASEFKQHISQLIDQLLATFPAALEHPTYQQKNRPSITFLTANMTKRSKPLNAKPTNAEWHCTAMPPPSVLHQCAMVKHWTKRNSHN